MFRQAQPPGGFEEATLSSPVHDRVYIKNCAGFIKLCLMHGSGVVPVYAFGERELFSNVQGMWKLRLWLNGKGIPAILPWGRWYAPMSDTTDRLLLLRGIHQGLERGLLLHSRVLSSGWGHADWPATGQSAFLVA